MKPFGRENSMFEHMPSRLARKETSQRAEPMFGTTTVSRLKTPRPEPSRSERSSARSSKRFPERTLRDLADI
jgi:hypothetical protein